MMVETNESEPRKGKTPVRTCAGCGKHDAADELVRVVLDPSESGEVAVDLAGSGFGRGAHVHAAPECLAKALKAGFSKVFKSKVTGELGELGRQIVAAADRRIEGLLSGARRARQIAIGADAVREALRDGGASLVVVARDAAAAASLPEVQTAIGGGNAVAWSDKARLGALFAKDEVAVCAVTHPGVAEAIASAHRTSRQFRSEAWSCPEVR
jgi:predicted RNA-binding protein YlxR (DUF448 family)